MAKEKKPKGRHRSRHPGVKLKKRTWPSGTVTWFARRTDPLTGKEEDTNLTRLGIKSKRARVAWAIEMSNHLLLQKARAARGEVQLLPETRLDAAIKDYLKRAAERLKDVSVKGYRISLAYLHTWAGSVEVEGLHELDKTSLAMFKDWLRRSTKRTPARQGRRGEREDSSKKMSPSSVNHYLAEVRVFLHEARRLGYLRPELNRDAISEILGRVREKLARPAILRPAELRQLLEASLRHDRATFSLTRAEKARGGVEGGTPRYRAVSPLILLGLLGGMRFKEMTHLDWAWVHLDDRQPEIVLPADMVKTGHERAVGLDKTPSLVRLLAALKLQRRGAYVLGSDEPASRNVAEGARRRLQAQFGAPKFTWQQLRQTCASYSSNAKSLWGDASAFTSAKRLGHSILVAEKRYAGLLTNLPDADTLEGVMGIEDLADHVVALVSERHHEDRRRVG
ncbi:phage integrase SAM-like domain-containing protein [bacterium AH-315-M10]|nr:phage integrase SAM-like domain-containing protein [bacterium AH-315-M10]